MNHNISSWRALRWKMKMEQRKDILKSFDQIYQKSAHSIQLNSNELHKWCGQRANGNTESLKFISCIAVFIFIFLSGALSIISPKKFAELLLTFNKSKYKRTDNWRRSGRDGILFSRDKPEQKLHQQRQRVHSSYPSWVSNFVTFPHRRSYPYCDLSPILFVQIIVCIIIQFRAGRAFRDLQVT